MYNFFEAKKGVDNAETIKKSYPKAIQTKFSCLIKDILENPRNKVAIGNPEQLKHTDIEKWNCPKRTTQDYPLAIFIGLPEG